MQIELSISKTNYEKMMTLIDKACNIIKASNPKPRDYNVARQLYLVKRQIEKQNIAASTASERAYINTTTIRL